MFDTITITDGVNLHVNETKQFKTVSIAIKFKTGLTAGKAAARSVLANILQHSNENYPSHTALRMVLDDLYGTSLYIDATKRGSEHIVSLNVETVNDQYLSEDGVLEKVLNLMHLILFKPNFENDLFKETVFNREKNVVKQRIESIFDDKTRYAQHRLTELAFAGHPASISANGTITDVEVLTNEALRDVYRSMLTEDRIDIYTVGDLSAETVAAYIQRYFPFGSRTPESVQQHPEIPLPAAPRVTETEDMKQGKLHIAYTSPVTFRDEKFPVMQLMNGVFGGYAHSKLFSNVREKESMAYYVSSSYSSQFGLLFVLAGIDQAMDEKAVRLITEQLDDVKKGNISDEELGQTKALLTNQLKEALDSARGQIEIYDQYMNLTPEFESAYLIEKWQQVTKEEIADAANDLSLHMIYFLTGQEGEPNDE
ncbi:EF-P 5-aminopentanol modification-associated protein YfmF [Planococcus lenghuensis]|uniref:Peptidase M16 n=1 Tax=Planococcus lenghuensis TaxID=2213202 RepID=A0A1Q2L1E3_9BACL|nr:pitrilysin family protein [Planococcus lenghuensis]AQQ53702.1 peptidase M16 [Planococcus lenghuensis]